MSQKRFTDLFSGLKRAYGTYEISTKKKSLKTVGKALTVRSELTDAIIKGHLDGHIGIGVIPIRENNTCLFAAIDIDQYEQFDPVNIANIIERNNWPLVTCRSKSGGAHVFMFLSEEVPAADVRAKLKEYALALGHGDAEIFPKQDELRSKNDVGNWINLPYYNSKRTTRFAIKNGDSLSFTKFLDHAESLSLTSAHFYDLYIDGDEFSDAPPCLQQLVMSGFPQGSRNNALFDMGVYARMKYPDAWQKMVYEYNERFMSPGSNQEVQQIIKSLDKKKYIYKCLEAPICGVCDKVICGQREFGVQSTKSPYKSAQNQKLSRPCILDEVASPAQCHLPPPSSDDEPFWVFTIHGQEMDVTIDMVQSQSKFLREYLKKFRKMVLPIDENRWAMAINTILDEAENIELAEDAGPEGQLWIHLEEFCTGKAQARVKDELILGKPWNDTENEEKLGQRIYFRSQDFMKYLDHQRFKQFKERQVYSILRRNGARHHKFMIKGKCVSCWSVTSFNQPKGTMDIPDQARSQY